MYSFVKKRSYAYVVAITLFIFSLLAPFILPVHQGIDLTGWIQIEYSVNQGNSESILSQVKGAIVNSVKQSLSEEEQKIITDTLAYTVVGTNNFIIEAWIDESQSKNTDGSINFHRIDSAKQNFITWLTKELSQIPETEVVQSRYVNIGASFGEYIKKSGYITLTLAVIGISIYIMYAFSGSIPGVSSWPFALVTALSLLHDVVISFGLYILVSAFFPEFKIDTFLFTAMLTVLWYSINDTIVILDKVRSTLKVEKKLPLEKIIDNSIHSTMRRSLFTSLTIFVVLVAMFIFGPDSISGFVLVLIFGVIVGTYSSVFIAAPALIDIIRKEK